MSLTNAQPRFAVESDTGTVFCYMTSQHYPPTGTQALPDGTWDMAKVKELILSGSSIAPALTKGQVNKEPVDNTDKAAQANADFEKKLAADRAAVDQDNAREQADLAAKSKYDSSGVGVASGIPPTLRS